MPGRKNWFESPAASGKVLTEKDWREMQQFLEALDYGDLLELGRRVNNLWIERALDNAADASGHQVLPA
jgi:hypothetical protein